MELAWIPFCLTIPLLYSGLVTPYRETIVIGVIMDAEMDQTAVSLAVSRVKDHYRKMVVGEKFDVTLKWIAMNASTPGQAARKVWDLSNGQTQALVTALRCSQSKQVSAMTEIFHIPHVAVDLEPCPHSGNEMFTFRLSPSHTSLAPAMVDTVQATGRKNVCLTFGTLVDYSTRQQVLVQLSAGGVRTVLRTATKAKTYDISERLPINRTWVVWIDDPNRENVVEPVGSGTIVLVMQSPSYQSGLVGLNSTDNITFWESRIAQAVLMFQKAFKNVVSTSGLPLAYSGGHKVMQEVDMISVSDYKNVTTWYDLYGIREDPERQRLIPVAEWTEDMGLTIPDIYPEITNMLFPEKLTDFGGITLRIAVHRGSPPYVSRIHSDNMSYHGLVVDMVDDLARKLNFRYTFVESPDGFYGTKMANGSFSGMIGMVGRGGADLGAAPFTVTVDRGEVVDFTTPFMQDSFGILTPKTREIPDMFQAFKAFNLDIWLSILASVFIASVVCVFTSLDISGDPNETSDTHTLMEGNVGENIFLVISSYFEQGPTFHPTTVSARCFLTSWCIFSLLIMAMYTANLAAVLTISTPVRPINTLQDLADRTDIEVAAMAGTNTVTFITQSKQTLYQKISKRLITTDTLSTMFLKVSEGNQCYLGDRSSLLYQAAQSCGETRVADEKINGFSLAFIVNKHSPYKKAISVNIQKMVESGLIDSLQNKWMRSTTTCAKKESRTGVFRLDLENLGGVFVLYGTFTFTAVLVFLMKVIYNRHHQCLNCT